MKTAIGMVGMSTAIGDRNDLTYGNNVEATARMRPSAVPSASPAAEMVNVTPAARRNDPPSCHKRLATSFGDGATTLATFPADTHHCQQATRMTGTRTASPASTSRDPPVGAADTVVGRPKKRLAALSASVPATYPKSETSTAIEQADHSNSYWTLRIAETISTPSPEFAPNHSPRIAPSRAAGIPSRSASATNGTAAGT